MVTNIKVDLKQFFIKMYMERKAYEALPKYFISDFIPMTIVSMM